MFKLSPSGEVKWVKGDKSWRFRLTRLSRYVRRGDDCFTYRDKQVIRRNRFSIGNPDKSDFYRRVHSIENVSLIEFFLYIGNLILWIMCVHSDYVLKNIRQHGLIGDFPVIRSNIFLCEKSRFCYLYITYIIMLLLY